MAYKPPNQGKIGQVIDVIVLLALTIGTLYIPLWLGLAGAAKTPAPIENPTWETLNQSPVAVERWNALGFADPASANDIITARFDYSFAMGELLIMAVVVIGYFFLIIRLSGKEYHEVIAEKFGSQK
jgi:hypothetical protein